MENWNRSATQGYINNLPETNKVVEAKPQITEQLERIFRHVEILEKATGELDRKISAITLPSVPLDRTTKEDGGNLIPFAQQLSTIANRIMGVSEFINDLINRVQL